MNLLRKLISYKNSKMKRLLTTVFVFIIVKFVILYGLIRVCLKERTTLSEVSLSLPYVIVHLDLKGAPPKLSYLKSLLPILKEHGANGLLIEYEDMFPYSGELKHLRSGHYYKKAELGHFLKTATEEGFEIIPLIQTFGHMEFVLKLNKYIDLREDSMYSDSICPTQTKSQQLLKSMLRQVLEFHLQYSRIRYMHIGCDEVYRMNICTECKQRNLAKEDIYLTHIVNTSTTITNMFPNMKILIWDDMLRHIRPKYLKHYKLEKYIQPVYWDYSPNLDQVSHATLYKYFLTFNQSLWVATAFKGADGKDAILPNLVDRFDNHYSWMKFMKGYNFGGKTSVSFKGVFLTGWSRYNHFEGLCELLPSSIHSLVLNLIVINECRNISVYSNINDYEKFFNMVQVKFKDKLHCVTDVGLHNFESYRCYYNERNVYSLLKDYIGNKTLYENGCGVEVISNTLKTIKNLNRNDVIKIDKQYDYFSKCLKSLLNFEEELSAVLKLYFDDFVVKEYLANDIGVFKNNILERYKYIQNNVKILRDSFFTLN